MEIPERKVVVGNPARVVKDVTDEMLEWKTEGTRLYQQLPAAMRSSWKTALPLREIPANRPEQGTVLRNWQETKSLKPPPGADTDS